MTRAPEAPAPAQRLDLWLCHARFARTRALAAALARSGHVRINGRRVSDAAARVRRDDVLTLALPGRTLVVRVVGHAERRGPAASVGRLYALLPESDNAALDDRAVAR